MSVYVSLKVYVFRSGGGGDVDCRYLEGYKTRDR